jgi:hypothetical protein
MGLKTVGAVLWCVGSGATPPIAASLFDPLGSNSSSAATSPPTSLPSPPSAPLPPWERRSCMELYGPRPSRHTPPITKMCWDSKPILRLDRSVLNATVSAWPPAADARGTTEEWLAALKPRQQPLPTSTHCYRKFDEAGTAFRGGKAKEVEHVYAILDEAHRAVYVSNLKSGSSTLSHLLDTHQLGATKGADKKKGNNGRGSDNGKGSAVLKHCMALNRNGGYNKSVLRRVVAKECNDTCNLTCSNEVEPPWGKQAQFLTTDIPDALMDRYLFFSFVRDPFLRSESSYYEATGHKTRDGYNQHLRGEGHASRNVHYRGQAFGLFGPGQSGRVVPMHFIGKLEHFEEDWGRLQAAMTPEAVALLPAERIALIPPRNTTEHCSSSATTSGTSGVAGVAAADCMSSTDKNITSNSTPAHLNTSSAARQQEATHGNSILASLLQSVQTIKNKLTLAKDTEHQKRRSKEGHSANYQPSNVQSKEPFTAEQELDICRRYLQDLICFDYGIPRSCIKHADLMLYS